MADSLTASVPADLDGERVDRIVAQLAGVSRSRSREWCEAGRVLVDGAPVEARRRLRTGQVVVFPEPEPEPGVVAEPVDFDVVYADDDLAVIDKPAGLVVHPGAGRSRGTLAGGLLHRFPDIEGVGDRGRWGLVHRLDRDTSGLLVVARTPGAFSELRRQLAERRVGREYLALVRGTFDVPRGTIEAPIEPDPTHPGRRRVAPGGKPAVTHYRCLRNVPDAGVSLLEVTLETGRTHQIRVHLAAIGHPVVGDPWYGRGPDPIEVPRLFLHAARLSFDHPRTGERLTFRAPLPPELAAVLARLGIDASGEEPPGVGEEGGGDRSRFGTALSEADGGDDGASEPDHDA